MKTFQLVLLVLLFPLLAAAQKSLTGVWNGVLTNDSTTVRSNQSFEIALTQYREKVYGYSRSTFIVNDTLFYMVRRVKGKIEDGICEVKDDDIISCNFPDRIDRGVKMTLTFRLNQADSTWKLDGNWKTNKTKRFYSISGKANLTEDKYPDNSRIIAHLQELNLKDAGTIARNPPPPTPKPVADKPVADKQLASGNVKDKPREGKPGDSQPSHKAVTKTPSNPVATAAPDTAQQVQTKDAPQKTQIAPPVSASSVSPALLVKERKTAVPQVINFVSDSLQLSLYDNGEIDGDTVSVLLNGEIILAKQGLKASAIRKTITVQQGSNEVLLVLYAENLGKYPPNTGLLIVHDGEETYQVRFSADLNENAAIIFRRKIK